MTGVVGRCIGNLGNAFRNEDQPIRVGKPIPLLYFKSIKKCFKKLLKCYNKLCSDNVTQFVVQL